MKNTDTESGGNSKLASVLSRWRSTGRLLPQELCPPRPPHEESRAYVRWGLAQEMGEIKEWGPDVFLFALFQRQTETGVSNPITESGVRVVALRPPFWYVTARGRVL